MQNAVPIRMQVGTFELDLRAGELRRGEDRVRLQEQPLQILLMLVSRSGEVVTRAEIKERLWPNDTVVDFSQSIHTAINKLRRALGDDAGSPSYIETVGSRGYRLIAHVHWLESSSDDGRDNTSGVAISSASLIGSKVSHYSVLAVVGGGGMGMVYEAEDLRLGRRVALKFLPDELSGDPVALQRFEREARTASSLNHPNICTIYAVEEHERQPFLVMELLEGETLRDRLASSKLEGMPLDELLKIAVQIARALEAAHKKGVIHRDIKPANIFLTATGAAKILDFGLAKLAPTATLTSLREPTEEGAFHDSSNFDATVLSKQIIGEHTLTRAGAAMGTAGYMSPEQVRGEVLDARTDLFSFGLVLYEMGTGLRAFTGETAALVRDAITNHTPTPPRELNPNIPASLGQLIVKALQKERAKRYQTAKEVREGLEAVEGKLHRGRTVRRWRALASLAILVGAALLGRSYWRSHRTIRLGETDTVVLSDFVNTTGEPIFDGTLKQALGMQLAQSPFLNVLSSERINATLKLMNHPSAERLTEVAAREVCLRTASTALLEGSIARHGGRYHLEVRVRDCKTEDQLTAASSEAASRDDVLNAVGIVGNQLREKLGESLASVDRYNQPLEQATTSSLEALQAYTQGGMQQSQKGDAAAVPYYKLAVDLDPNFAYAYAALGQAHFTLYQSSAALADFKHAFDLRDRVSERERFYIEGAYYSMAGTVAQTIRTYEEWSKSYPRDWQPHNDLSRRLRSTGEYERAAAEARLSVSLNSESVSPYSSLMLAYIRLNKLDEAKRTFEEARMHKVDGPYLRLARYQVAFLEGDPGAMAEQIAETKGKLGVEDILINADAYAEAFHGRLRTARAIEARAIEEARQTGAPERAAIYLSWFALLEASFDRPDRALQAAGNALALSGGAYVEAKTAMALALAGDSVQAQELADRVNQELPLETMEQSYSLPAIRAAIELARNNPQKAIDILKVTLPYELGASSICCMLPTYVRGLAYLKLGQGQNASHEFHKVLRHPGTTVNFVTGALAHLQLGRAQLMMDDKDAARESYNNFLTLWSDADTDTPVYRQAKAEYARLR